MELISYHCGKVANMEQYYPNEDSTIEEKVGILSLTLKNIFWLWVTGDIKNIGSKPQSHYKYHTVGVILDSVKTTLVRFCSLFIKGEEQKRDLCPSDCGFLRLLTF